MGSKGTRAPCLDHAGREGQSARHNDALRRVPTNGARSLRLRTEGLRAPLLGFSCSSHRQLLAYQFHVEIGFRHPAVEEAMHFFAALQVNHLLTVCGNNAVLLGVIVHEKASKSEGTP